MNCFVQARYQVLTLELTKIRNENDDLPLCSNSRMSPFQPPNVLLQPLTMSIPVGSLTALIGHNGSAINTSENFGSAAASVRRDCTLCG